MNDIILSKLGHTWIIDLDGTILKHNGYKIDGEDSFLPGAKVFLKSIPDKDMIIFLTSRTEIYRDQTVAFLIRQGIRFDQILFKAPFGERILINDKKPSGLPTALAINTERDTAFSLKFMEDADL